MANLSVIADRRLRNEVSDLSRWLNGLMAGKKSYSFRKLMGFRDDVIHKFQRYIKRRRKEIKDDAKQFDTTKKEIDSIFQFAEKNINSAFERNMIRAFGTAANSIEKTLGEEVDTPGFFGIRALLSLTGRRPKPQDLKRVEGFSRLTKNRRIYRIDLIPYIIQSIRTNQEEWERKLSEAIAFTTNIDLVAISPHPSWLGPKADEVCNRWRDRIVSLSGLTNGFPRMQEALDERPPLFHPNCTHGYKPLTIVEQNVAINRKIKTYKTLVKYV